MEAPMTKLLDQAKAWRDADSDAETRAALDGLIEAADKAVDEASGEATTAQAQQLVLEQLASCFEPPLTFGTAGLRGLKGPGPAYMNHLLIQRVTAVIADVLRAEVPDARQAWGGDWL